MVWRRNQIGFAKQRNPCDRYQIERGLYAELFHARPTCGGCEVSVGSAVGRINYHDHSGNYCQHETKNR